MTSCVDRYLELAGDGVKLRTVSTPFLVEGQGTSPQGAPSHPGPYSECPWCKHTPPANMHKPARDSNWKEAAGVHDSNAEGDAADAEPARKDVDIPPTNIKAQSDNDNIEVRAVLAQSSKETGGTPPPSPDTGRLQPITAKVPTQVFYAARLCHFDLLRAVCHLATSVTKWTSECDRKLHRLVRYIRSPRHLRMIGWVGDKLDALRPHLFADDDFAGCTYSVSEEYFWLSLRLSGTAYVFPDYGS